MKPTISVHAGKRKAESGSQISEEGIQAIIASSATVSIPSKTDSTAALVIGKHDDKIWCIVLNIDTLNVITVRRASKQERRIYAEKVENKPIL
jgi:uncharacterized DUF497 family protein